MGNQNNKSYWKCANRLGLFFAVLFVICFLWYYLRTTEQGLHLQLFRLAFLGFEEMNVIGFILGIVQSYLWAYIVAAILRLFGCCWCRKEVGK